ncbi:hypothetical protein CTE07_52990 [Chitinophaga terrae (ex Kim and Jung 2007)]|nr:hypothetical protein CTE07_52990 [Chitinophaga terrae (ex Kim and Jung 2007)]
MKLNNYGILYGFQLVDGSFVEDIEKLEGRAPNDVDLLTFYHSIPIPVQKQILQSFPEFSSPREAKLAYKVDHYAIDYGCNPDFCFEVTRYWMQLFTHNRNGIWKGIIRLPLNTPIDDQQALTFLNS